MKAAFLVASKTFELRDVCDPAAPDDGFVLDVKACGVCGSDVRRWREGPPVGSGGIIPGHEAAGVVCAVGKACGGFAVGDKLAIAPDIHCGQCYYCQRGLYNLCDSLHFLGITPGYPGAFAERMLISAEVLQNGIVHRMPDGLSFEHAAVSELSCSVLATQNDAGTKLGDTVVVLGAGPAGCLHIAVAKQRGARVAVSEPTETRREMARRFEPDLLIDPTRQDIVQAVRQFTDGVGADIVVCANPVAETQTRAVEMVRKRGRVILFGGLPKANPMTTLDSNLIHYGEIVVVGAFSYHPTIHAMALQLIAGGKIPADKLITHTFGLDQIDKAYRTAETGSALKVVIKP